MTKNLALLTIMPSMLWFLTMNSGYSQGDPNNVNSVAPLYFSYTHNIPLTAEQLMILEYWMVCDVAFEYSSESCCYLEEWILNNVCIMGIDKNDLEDWMLSDMLTSDISDFGMEEWMLGFEPIVEMALHKSESSTVIEEWMLEFGTVAQQYLQDAWANIKDWMWSNSYSERENVMNLEDWMVDGLSMY